MTDTANYWVVTASADHAANGAREAIVQAGHGKDAPLRRLRPGDGVVIYSPKETYPDGAALQAFTLIGRVASGEPYQHDMGTACMWRRDMLWQTGQIAPIRPMLDMLDLTRGQKSWGGVFRYGLTKISRADFAVIARAMVGTLSNGAGDPI